MGEPARSLTPHVAMIVANDVSADTRVLKMAHDLAASGLRVTVFGVSKSGRREDYSLGSATVSLLPVGTRLRIRRGLGGRLTNRHQITHEISILRARFFAFQRSANADIAWLRADYFRDRARRNEAANVRARRRNEKRRGTQEQRENAGSRALLGRLGNRVDRAFDSVRKKRQERKEQRFEAAFRRAEARLSRHLERRHARYSRSERKLEKLLTRVVESGDGDDWRKRLPELHDFEIAFGPALDAIDVDVIHAQDVHLLGVAARAASRARARGKTTKLVYDAHEYIQGLALPRPVRAWSSLEREYINRADAVITVAPAIAQVVQEDYDLEDRPTVVMNIPVVGANPPKTVREAVDLDESALVLVYSGGLDVTRGVHTLVSTLGKLPEAHLVLVSKAETAYTRELEEMARGGGYIERLHFAPFVEPQHVVGYLAGADVGVHTIVSGPINHELTLPNKVFEYMHARLPIVISDCRAMAELVERLGVGRAFASEDADSLAEVLQDVIAHRRDYVSVYESSDVLDTYSWTTERSKLLDLYGRLIRSDSVSRPGPSTGLPSLIKAAN